MHYFYMRDVWVTGETPTVYRYIDWLITVPLLMVEFFLILSAITTVPARIFWEAAYRYNADAGFQVYLGEAGYMDVTAGFVLGMAAWIYVLYEIFKGEAGQLSAENVQPAVQSAFNLMRNIYFRLGDLSAWLFDGLYDGQC